MATVTAIPLQSLSQGPPSTGSSGPTLPPAVAPIAASSTASAANSTGASTAAAPTRQSQTSAVVTSQRSIPQASTSNPLWQQLLSFCTSERGLGGLALICAVAFGIGAWVGTHMQVKQGAQSLELSIWATCMDHENVQNTTLCQSVMSKSFDRFGERSVHGIVPRTDVTVKREEIIEVMSESSVDLEPKTRIESFIEGLGTSEKAFLSPHHQYDQRHDQLYEDLPELRATIFPFVNLLYVPIRFFFSAVESLLLAIVFGIHKITGWISAVVWFSFQLILYSTFESVVKSFFQFLDAILIAILPEWVPSVLVYGLPTAIGMSLLKSYWYGVDFWFCLKWMMIVRFGLWVGGTVIYYSYEIYAARNNKRKRID